jgi:hypothetical protein
MSARCDGEDEIQYSSATWRLDIKDCRAVSPTLSMLCSHQNGLRLNQQQHVPQRVPVSRRRVKQVILARGHPPPSTSRQISWQTTCNRWQTPVPVAMQRRCVGDRYPERKAAHPLYPHPPLIHSALHTTTASSCAQDTDVTSICLSLCSSPPSSSAAAVPRAGRQ